MKGGQAALLGAAPAQETLPVSGLTEPVQIVRDKWGVRISIGPKEVKRDIGNRLFMYRGDLQQEFNWYHPHGGAIVDAFVNGINAYVGETQRNPALLPEEFRMLGIRRRLTLYISGGAGDLVACLFGSTVPGR